MFEDISRNDLLYLDLIWFGVDSLGHLGKFTTNRTGLVPDDVLRNNEIYGRAIEMLETLPRIAEYKVAAELWKWRSGGDGELEYVKEFGFYSERGFFSYDCWNRDGVEGPYFQVTRPENAITLSDLSKKLRLAVSRIVFDLRFDRSSEIMSSDWRCAPQKLHPRS